MIALSLRDVVPHTRGAAYADRDVDEAVLPAVADLVASCRSTTLEDRMAWDVAEDPAPLELTADMEHGQDRELVLVHPT